MGLLDQVIGAVAGQLGGRAQGGGNPIMQMVLQLVQNHPGGLQGLIQQFTQAGLGQQAQSWVSTGANMPISADDLARVFGGASGGGAGPLGQILSQLGMSQEQAMGGLADALPQVVDQLTPNGSIDPGSVEQSLTGLLDRFR